MCVCVCVCLTHELALCRELGKEQTDMSVITQHSLKTPAYLSSPQATALHNVSQHPATASRSRGGGRDSAHRMDSRHTMMMNLLVNL